MISPVCSNILCFVLLLSFCSIVCSQNVNVTISLNKTLTNSDKELYGDFYTINGNSTLKVNLENVNKEVAFFIFQAHSHLHNITLYNNTRVRGSFIMGRNLGLYGKAKKPYHTYYIVNDNQFDLKVYISVHGYLIKDPVPGGNNLEFPINISPFLYAKYNQHYINIDAQLAGSINGPLPRMSFYRMYLPERQFDEDIYFEGIRNMMTKGKILENGVEVPQTISKMPMRRMLGAYRGTGSVYVVIAYNDRNDSIYSVYVPTTSYACSPLEQGDCQLLSDITSQLFCASLLFIGLFTCYFGHRFFKTEMFLVGALTGVIFTYIMISLMQDLEPSALLGASVLSGVFFGAIWLLFWWFYGIPVLAVFLPALQLGFLCSSIVYFELPGGHILIHRDDSFWGLFIMIMILTSVVLLSAAFLSNILCCAIIGAYATVFAVDNYLGSNLKYIVINTVRRAVVEKFNYVILAPPFQWRDVIVTLLWVMLAISGFLYQHYHNRGKPPFPPPPRSIAPRMPGTPFFGVRNRNRYGAIEDGVTASAPELPSHLVVVDERTPMLM